MAKDKMYMQKGHTFRILSYNTCYFTCGWLTDDETLHIETPTRSIKITNATNYINQ